MTISIPGQPEIECSVDAEFDDSSSEIHIGPPGCRSIGLSSNVADNLYEDEIDFVERAEGYCFPDPVIIPAGKQLNHVVGANIDRKLELEFGFEVSASPFV